MRKALLMIVLVTMTMGLIACNDSAGPTTPTEQAEILFKMKGTSFNRCGITAVNMQIDGQRKGTLQKPQHYSYYAELRLIIAAGKHRYYAESSDGRYYWGPEEFLTNQPLVKVITLTCGE